jgi:malonyl-CoA/methylmalonyl-CoA synthetase
VPAEQWSPHLATGAREFSPSDLVAGGSLPVVWAERWRAAPTAPVLLDRMGEPRDWCHAGELDERTRAEASRLAERGLAPGDRLLWSCAPSLEAVVSCVGALRLGAVVVPANPAYSDRELEHIVRDVRPTMAVTDSNDRSAAIVSSSAGATTVLGPADQRQPPPSYEPILDASAPDDPALIVYTSGTTGAPKGAVLSHANLLAGVGTLVVAWGWTPEDRLALALPLFHVHGLCAGLFGTLAAGGSAVLTRFDPSSLLDDAARHRATLFFGVPTMYSRLLASGRAGELASLRLCVSGSAPLPIEVFDRLAGEAGFRPLERYGMTETLLTLSNPLVGERRAGSVGFPLPGVRARVDDDGALWVRGPSVFAGYWEKPAANAECLRDGWFRTGDVVSVDPDGYFRIRGRSGDLIITGGYNVYPAEVEDVLLAHPAVAEVAVTGEPSPEWGESVVAWVVADGALDLDDLASFAAARLAPYKRPRAVRLLDALPRNAMGKVERSALR